MLHPRRVQLAAIAVALLALGGATAWAVSGTTGTVVACAHATVPAQTLAVNGSPVATVPAATSDQCVTTTYTIPTVTVTGTTATTTTATTTTTPTTTTASSSVFQQGVYRGAANPTGVQKYEGWLGHKVTLVEDFEASDSWTSISQPDWWLSGWQGSGYQLVLSVPMVPGTSYLSDSQVSSMLQQGASGAFNGYFRTLGQDLVSHGFADAYVRLGWEMNGGWYNWRAAPNPTAWVAYFRQAVSSLRATDPQVRIVWNPNAGWNQLPTENTYPGDAYVDYIGVDAYDQAWGSGGSIVSDPATRWANYVYGGSYGLKWFSSFAQTHGKPLVLPEWGITLRTDGHGGGDDPYYVNQMYSFMADPANNVAWESYFEFDAPDGKHMLSTGEFPNSAVAFLATFGQ